MKLFPPDVYFYINSWTWGYEDVIKAVAAAFQTKVFPSNLVSPCISHVMTSDTC